MRVISGTFRGRKLKSLKGDSTRPTTDKVKESIFNMIGPYFDGGVALDLFAGSGGLAIEAVSRGMEKAYCVDKNYQAIKIIRDNVESTQAQDKFSIMKMSANQAIRQFSEDGRQFDLIFLDPPYARQMIEEQLQAMDEEHLLHSQAIVVCETAKEIVLSEKIGSLIQFRRQNYGITAVTLYRNEVQ